MSARFILPSLLVAAVLATAAAQSPAPVVVPAASPAALAPASAQAAAPNNTSPLQSSLKSLFEMKAANAEILKKQEATLLQLEEMAKAAEQIKIYTKRG